MTFRPLFRLGIAIITVPAVGLITTPAIHAQAEEKEFSPINEAKMPVGFPRYTPVGAVQVKRYPAYRKAEADVKGGRAFWTLFSHIKQNDIAMTAPVEMTYPDRERPREATMAFLYGHAKMGRAGRQNKVQVVDVPPREVISTGVRGPRTTKSVAEARDRLEAWLEANEDLYTVDGQLRVMAYNSPFVPRDRNFFEVEIPIRPLEPAASSANGN